MKNFNPNPVISALTLAMIDNPQAYLRDLGITEKPKKTRKTLAEINRQIDKVEKKLDSILSRFIRFTDDLYIKTEGENFAHVDTHGEFVNLWEICKEDKAEWDFPTNFIKPNEIFVDWNGDFEEYPEAFKRLHFLENRREAILEQREKLLQEYWAMQAQKKSA